MGGRLERQAWPPPRHVGVEEGTMLPRGTLVGCGVGLIFVARPSGERAPLHQPISLRRGGRGPGGPRPVGYVALFGGRDCFLADRGSRGAGGLERGRARFLEGTGGVDRSGEPSPCRMAATLCWHLGLGARSSAVLRPA